MKKEYKKHCSGFKIAGGIVLGIGFASLFGWVIMLLWNALMPVIFKLTVINYWQALGIAILARLLFGGLHGGHKSSKRDHRSIAGSCHAAPDQVKDWHYYDKWWNNEGEKAFRDYAEKERADEKK